MAIQLDDTNTGIITLKPGASGNYSITFPTAVAAVNGYVLSSDTSGNLSWIANGSGGGSMVYPSSGIANSTGSAWGTSYSTTGSSTVVALGTSPSFTTDIRTPKVTTASAANLVLDTNAGTSTGSITINTGVNGNIAITPNGTGNVNLGDTTANGLLTTGSATANLVLNTNSGTTSGAITIFAGANGNITLTPNGTGVVDLGAVGSVRIAGGANTNLLSTNGSGVLSWVAAPTFTQVYPASGIPNSTGSAWGTSYSTTGSSTVVALGTSPSFTTDIRTPKVTTASAVSLVLDTNTGTNSGTITIFSGVNGNIAIAPNGTGAATFSTSIAVTGAGTIGGTTTVANASSNFFTLTGAASGTGPTVAAAGATDANVNFNVQTKGTGSFVVASTTTNTTSNITASGANANINLVLAGKGTGTVIANTLTISTVGAVTSGTWNGTAITPAFGGTGQTTYTNGQLLIGNTTGNTLTKATLTQGSGITITNGNGSISIANASPMTYPGSGIANSTGTAWGTSYTTTGSGTVVALQTQPSFTTDIRTPKVTTASAVNLVLDTNAGTSTGNITLTTGLNADIAVTPNGTGNVRLGDTTASGIITTGAAAASLTLSTNNGTNSGTIVIAPGVNGNITITPNGTGLTDLGAVARVRITGGSNTNLLSTNGSGVLSWVAAPTFTQAYPASGIPNSTGSAWGTSYSTTGSSTVVALGTSPSFTTDIRTPKVTTASAVNLVLDTNAGTNSGNITINQGVNGNIVLTPNGTGTVVLGDTSAAGTVTTGGAAANLTLHTNSGTNSGTIIITAGANNSISLTPNGVGVVNIGGTGAIKLPVGTDAQQPGQASQATAAQGMIRYNTTQSRFEGYNGSTWGQIGGGIPGGANTQVQFNNSNVFAGSSNFVWNNGTNTLTITGTFNATTKSFFIDHPTRPGMKLVYGSLEGPEHGVYSRGRLTGSVIELPEHWLGLVDASTITVDLTPIGKHQKLYVEKIEDNKVFVGNDNLFSSSIDCFYTVWATRKDVGRLEVEVNA